MFGLLESFVTELSTFIEKNLDTGFSITVVTYTVIVTICFAIGTVRSVWELVQALDLRFDKSRLNDYNMNRPEGTAPRKIDWSLARKQQVQSLSFTLPLGVVVLATLYCWLSYSLTFYSYAVIGLCWIVGYVLIRPWWISTLLRTERKLVKVGSTPTWLTSPLYNKSLAWAMRHYLNWGLQGSTQRPQAFIGTLGWLNPIIGIFRLQWLRVRLILPLIICSLNAALWPISLPISVFSLHRQFRSIEPLKPSWARSGAPKPTYGTGAIGDTPGDAAAAATN